MTGSVWRAVVVSGLALALAGCGGDETAAPSSTSIELHGGTPVTGPERTSPVPPTETATAGPGATATAGPPQMPAVARTNSEEGAKAFAVWYFESMNYSVQHPQAPIPDYADPSCDTCKNYAKSLAKLNEEGLRYSNAIFEPQPKSVDRTGSRYLVNIDMLERDYVLLGADGKTSSGMPSTRAKYQPDIVWKEGRWVILEIRANAWPTTSSSGS